MTRPAEVDAFVARYASITDEKDRTRLLAQVKALAGQQAPEKAFQEPQEVEQALGDLRAALGEHDDPREARRAVLRAAERIGRAKGPERPAGLLAQRVLLGSLLRDGVPPTPWLPSGRLGERLFYAESTWIVSGHKKSGKSWALLSTALDVADAGRPVVYLDFENGYKRFTRRLIQLGADPDTVDAHLHYIGAPKGLTLDGMGVELDDIAEALPGAFVIIDSLRGYMARLSPAARPLDPNAAQDVEAVCAPLNDVAHGRGLTVGIIDHAKKTGSDSDEYATSGSQAKEAAVDAVYFWTKVERYNRDVAGLVKLAATSDRDGELDFERFYKVGGQGGAPLRFVRADADEVGPMGKTRDAVFMFLGEHEGESFTANAVVESKAVTGKAENIRKALELLAAADPHVFKEPNPNRTGSFVYTLDLRRDKDEGALEVSA